MSGYCGKLLRVNLSAETVATEAIDGVLARKFLGGRGLGMYYLAEEVAPEVEALSPENKLILATGPLTGTPAPASGRYVVVTKSPLSGTAASSNSGGFWGPELKAAGYDMIIIEGKAPAPRTLEIRDGAATLADASEVWGKLVGEATEALASAFGDDRARVLTIGPAGERLSRLAAVMNDKNRAAGRSGVGAVMGSKNLKAVVVRGTGKVAVADDKAVRETVRAIIGKLRKDPVTGEALPKLGTASLVTAINEKGIYPTRNFRQSTFAGAEHTSAERLRQDFVVRTEGCYRCPIRCGRVSRSGDLTAAGPEYETIWAFSADCGVDDLAAVIEANHLCNEYGLDTISAGATIACAMELAEIGALTEADVGEAPPRFGSAEAIVKWTQKMGAGEGFGARLAQGAQRLAAMYGAPDLAMTVKGLELPAYDPRGAQGQGLSYATSNRGGCHLRGFLIAPEILGVPVKLDPLSVEGKAGWAKASQNLNAAIDSLGVCLFTSYALGADDYCRLFNVVVGEQWSVADLLRVGERVWNLERVFNLKAGISPRQDTLPRRLLNEPVADGPAKGQVHRLGEMLPQYYRERGWSDDGIPTQETLAALDLA